MHPSSLRLLFPVCLLLACGVEADDSDSADGTATGSTGDAAEPHATFTGKVDIIGLCGTEGATVVTFLARRVGCESLVGPCTIKVSPYAEWSGDAVTCPGSQTALDMRVDVPMSGRYQVEARTGTLSGFQSLCYGEGADVPTLATAAQIEARAEIFVEQTAKPCPDPS